MTDTALALRIQARLARLLAPPSGPLVRLLVEGGRVGSVTPDRAARLGGFPAFSIDGDDIVLACPPSERSEAMASVARELAREGALTAWRDELYAVRAASDAPVLFELERAAARYFGIHTYAAHVNGLVRANGSTRMWLARRSARKAIDPGMLDNLVGGGIASGATVEGTIVKESHEEAGIPAEVAVRAVRASELTIFRQQPDGIQHETIYAHDLWLDAEWVPANQDGEAVEHRLVELAEVAHLIGSDEGNDTVTADASLVALDCLRRLGALPPAA